MNTKLDKAIESLDPSLHTKKFEEKLGKAVENITDEMLRLQKIEILVKSLFEQQKEAAVKRGVKVKDNHLTAQLRKLVK